MTTKYGRKGKKSNIASNCWLRDWRYFLTLVANAVSEPHLHVLLAARAKQFRTGDVPTET